MTSQERLSRLEDALIDLTVIITEGQLFRLERYVGIGCAEASSRLMKTAPGHPHRARGASGA